ncbi:hypothetical protein [Aquibacillus rhizosphaerae]|uniref:DUF2157 domain-containing protein n=1 Tax=Aquibacillus rhizosphaerae TaxID=3051431 RepID=A0ABT7L5M8_9BACI|nr:hypothetical protein [Aquibacillus sp. LR5S19]MDL4841173.1 hypothetical protein [Aquibacillus sp. LR5S19]
MDRLTDLYRQRIMREELMKLEKQGFISEEKYNQMIYASEAYIKSQSKQRHSEEELLPHIDKPKAEANTVNTSNTMKKEKKVKTPEQIRERNITWSLILGVIFLLIGGLVLATSTWDQMGPILKVFSISFVSIFFLILSGISSRFLKINKTAFAFLTLGSMLIPIAIIAIGYFELFGQYLSLTGEGRFLLGLMGTLLPLPLYIRNAYRHQARLFVWISYLFLSFAVGFAIASIDVSVDFFYFLIMIFNGLLLLGYHLLKSNTSIQVFMKELPSYAQLNLVISTLLMLFIYDKGIFYSFNILVTAAIYIAMVFLYNTKEYQFVFSALFAYGVYQLTEYSFLESLDLIVYALVGIVYIGFSYGTKKQHFMSKMFEYTSGIISFFAFVYVSYQGLILRVGEDSILLLFAYFIISCNYIYLAHLTKRKVFSYLSPLFLLATGMQFWDSISLFRQWDSLAMFMFLFSACLFLWLGIWTKNKYFLSIQTSTYYVTIGAMFLCVLYGLWSGTLIQLAIMLVLFGVLAIIVANRNRRVEKEIATWVHAVSWTFALVVIYPEVTAIYPGYDIVFNWPFHLAVSGIILLAIHVIWRRFNKKSLAMTSFYVGQGAYFIGLIQLITVFHINEEIVRPLLLFVGVGVFVWLVYRVKENILWLLVAITVFCFYTSLLSVFKFQAFTTTITFLLIGVVLLLAISHYAGKRLPELKPYFFWLAHGVQAVLLLIVVLDQIMSQSINPIVLLISVTTYLYSSIIKEKEWQVKLHLYGAMTMLATLVATIIPYYNLFETIPTIYYWLGSSLLYALVWLLVNQAWRNRIEWYIIPFSIYGLFTIVTIRIITSPLEIIPIIGYVILNLFFLHKRKWSLITILPLLATLVMWEQLRSMLETNQLLFISISCFFILFVVGRLIHKKLYSWNDSYYEVDWYSFIAASYLVYAWTFINQEANVWLQLIPFVLLTLWLFSQVNRVSTLVEKRVIKTAGAISFLPSYYLLLLLEYKQYIPNLLHAELTVFPLLTLSIILSITTWNGYKKLMQSIQLILLLFITTYLIMDAIQSNTVWDALIVGSLSLLAMIIGMQAKIKAYFFVGVGTLIFNLLYQTKAYWGNMPWWGYLLIAGFTLIAVASYNEWQKQTSKEGKIKKGFKKMLSTLKEWD